MSRTPWHYYPNSLVERGRRYKLRPGYTRVTDSHGTTEYPWLTKREAQSFAKRHGAKAVFHKDRDTAIKAIKKEITNIKA